MKKTILKIKPIVEDLLINDTRARASDWYLVIRGLNAMGFKIYIPYDRISEMPSFESFRRCRQKLQAEGKYLPDELTEECRNKHRRDMKDINLWYPESPELRKI